MIEGLIQEDPSPSSKVPGAFESAGDLLGYMLFTMISYLPVPVGRK